MGHHTALQQTRRLKAVGEGMRQAAHRGLDGAPWRGAWPEFHRRVARRGAEERGRVWEGTGRRGPSSLSPSPHPLALYSTLAPLSSFHFFFYLIPSIFAPTYPLTLDC
jgi:hypothetical protein